MTDASQSQKPIRVESPENEETVVRINEFFNSTTIKQELNRFTYRAPLDRTFNRKDRRLLYVEQNGDVVGALMVWCESSVLDEDEAQIRLIAVAPAYRRHGIARRLCEEAEAFAVDQSQSKMSADVHSGSPAVEFWQSCGYEVAYDWETDNGRTMNRMEKSLPE